MAARISARETALLLGRTPVQGEDTTQLQRELRAAVRDYERTALKLRKLRAQVRRLEKEVKDKKRTMKLWFQTIEAPTPHKGGEDSA